MILCSPTCLCSVSTSVHVCVCMCTCVRVSVCELDLWRWVLVSKLPLISWKTLLSALNTDWTRRSNQTRACTHKHTSAHTNTRPHTYIQFIYYLTDAHIIVRKCQVEWSNKSKCTNNTLEEQQGEWFNNCFILICLSKLIHVIVGNAATCWNK